MGRSRGGSALTAFALLVYAYMSLPMLMVVYFSFSNRSFFTFPPDGFSLRWYRQAWQSGLFLVPAVRSIVLAVGATLAGALLTIPAGLALRRLGRSWWARATEFVLLSPLIVPALILGIALLYFFHRASLIDTFAGLLAAHTVLVLPFMFRGIFVSVHGLNAELEEASEILGASPFTTFRRVVLPALRPGIIAGGIFSFIVSFDQFTVSLFVTQSKAVTLPIALYKYLYDVNDPVVAAVSSFLVAFGLLVTVLIQRAGWLEHIGGISG